MNATAKIEKMRDQLVEWKEYFEDLSTKKQDKYDKASDKWQESEKGDECQQDILDADDIANDFDTVITNIESVFEI